MLQGMPQLNYAVTIAHHLMVSCNINIIGTSGID